MRAAILRTLWNVVCLAVIVVAAPRSSQAESIQRIRTTSSYVQAVLVTATEKSATLRSIVDRITASNVIVYITCDRFGSVALYGRTIWATGNREARYLRVEIDCMLTQGSFIGILAHELQHVAEVADATDVVDEASFGKLFATVGYATCNRGPSEQFETDAAIAAGERVRTEVLYGGPVGARVVSNARRSVPMQ